MNKIIKKICTGILLTSLVAIPLSRATSNVFASELSSEESIQYEIYPLVKNISYSQGSLDLNNGADLFLSEALDEYTISKAKSILDKNDIAYSIEDTENPDILVGIKGNDDKADQFIKENAAEADIFDNFDAYSLLVKENTIAIVGKDTDAAFYGLETLDLILRQANKNVRNLAIDDYASTKYRGVIEGYYGNPWTWDDRIANLEFGGQFKDNIFVFAPKDDPYHNKQWRDLYPEDQLAEIARVSKAGNENKNRFVWMIHPFMNNPITRKTIDQDTEKLIEKFEQLYGAGVRQFGVLADDININNISSSRSEAYQVVIDVMKSLSEWAISKGDVYDLLFCPTSYTLSWNWNAYELNAYDQNFPDNVQFFFTGSSTMSTINKRDVDTFKTRQTNPGQVRRDPLFWLNWSVNDIDNGRGYRRVYLSHAEMLNNDVDNIVGAVTNPMEHAHLSQHSIFTLANYSWNIADFDSDQTWEDSFKYVEPTAYKELKEFARHNQSSEEVGYYLKESEELKPYIDAFQDAIKGKDINQIQTSGQQLKSEYQKIADNVDAYRQNASHIEVVEELDAYLDSMKDTANTAIAAIDTIIAYKNDGPSKEVIAQNKEVNELWKVANSHTFNSRGTEYPTKTGSKRIRPNIENMMDYLNDVAYDPDATEGPFKNRNINASNIITSNYSAYQQYTPDKMIDKNDSTFVWWQTPGDKYKAGDYVGLDLKHEYPLGRFRLVMGGSSKSDYFKKYEIVYSNDKVNWTRYKGPIEQNTAKQTTEFNFKDDDIKARYVAVRSLTGGPYWVQVTDFMVETLGDWIEDQKDEYKYNELKEAANIDKKANEIISKASDSDDYPLAFASFTNDPPESNDRVTSLNDGIIDYPESNGTNRWTTWQRTPIEGKQYIGILFGDRRDDKYKVSGLSLHFFEDNGTKKPARIRVQYYKNDDVPAIANNAHLYKQPDHPFNKEENWEDVKNLKGLAFDPSKGNDISFDEVETRAIRVVMLPEENKSLAVTELEVWGKELNALDKNKLRSNIKYAENRLSSGTYTKDSKENLEKALKEARDVLVNRKASKEEINKANTKLVSTSFRLVKDKNAKVDKDKLEKAINIAKSTKVENYTSDSVESFKKALANAEKIYKDENASQVDVNKATSELTNASSKLVLKSKVDKSKLDLLIRKAKKFEKAKYDQRKWANFEKALSNAEEINNSDKSSQMQVNSAYSKLLKALVNLR